MSSFVRAGGAALATVVLGGLGLMGMAGPAAAAPLEHHGAPAGNNGVTKIIGPGDIDATPENNPHQQCQLGVEWYNFEKGQDVVSDVSFELIAPTADGKLTVDGPSQVPVGDDDASGGTDLDGRQFYTLSSTGTPHPKQGFHVKVTVHTPHSLGNDSKTKVFWFQPCGTDEAAAPVKKAHDKPAAKPTAEASAVAVDSASAAPQSAQSDSAVPTNIDAGLAGSHAEDSSIPPLWPILALVAAAAAVGGGIVVMRRRATR